MMEERIAVLNHVMAAETTDKTVMAEALWNELASSAEKKRVKLFEHVLCNFGLIESNGHKLDNHGLTDLTWSTLLEKDGQFIRKKIDSLFAEKSATSDTCKKLWDYLLSFKTREEKIFTLALLLFDADSHVPLLTDEEKKGAVTLTDEKFSELKVRLNSQIDLILNIKTGGFKTWTEMASAILYQLDKVDTIEEKAFLMVFVLAPKIPESDGKKDFPGVVDISDEKFESYKDLLDGKENTIAKLLATDIFEQRTEKAGAIFSFIMEHEDTDFQIILMSQVLRIVAPKSHSIGGATIVEMSGSTAGFLGKLLELKLSGKCDTCEKTQCPAHPRFEG